MTLYARTFACFTSSLSMLRLKCSSVGPVKNRLTLLLALVLEVARSKVVVGDAGEGDRFWTNEGDDDRVGGEINTPSAWSREHGTNRTVSPA